MKVGKGYFIAFEGIDGSGKSVAADAVAAELTKAGFRVALTHEPTKGPIGKKIYDILYHRQPMIDALELQKLYILDRKGHINEFIRPALGAKKVVLCDRYWFSTIAHGMLSESQEALIRLHDEMLGPSFVRPDITFLFDLPAEIAIERLKKIDKGADHFEKLEKLEAIRKNYLFLSQQKELGEVVVLDATQKQGQAAQKVTEILFSRLAQRG